MLGSRYPKACFKIFGLAAFLMMPLMLYPRADYSIILDSNIFTRPEPPAIQERPIIKSPEPVYKPVPLPLLSSLMEITGILHAGSHDSFAIITFKGRQGDHVFRTGDFVGEAEILSIKEEEIVFFYEGREQSLSVEKHSETDGLLTASEGVMIRVEEPSSKEADAQSGIPDFEEPVVVNFNEALEELRNNPEIFDKINVSPIIKDGKVDGFMVSGIPAGSLPHVYGLRDGDVVRRVNGIFIDSMARGLAVYNQIKNSGDSLVTVEILRNNQPLVLTYNLR